MVSNEAGLIDWPKVRKEAFYLFLIIFVFREAFEFDAELFWLDITVIFLLKVDGPSFMHLPDECEDEQA